MTGDTDGLSPEMLDLLARIRSRLPEGFYITSGVRPDSRSHSTGHAVDIGVTSSRRRYQLVRAALLEGVCRIGIYDRHIHLDINDELDQQVMWHGMSLSSRDVS